MKFEDLKIKILETKSNGIDILAILIKRILYVNGGIKL
ncbi:MAG: hypothetical protein K0R93_813 [Anaerosolibacter sp.]|jgi:hypothetical protein|nr:hypothetical protein [Anaerosolibacter sp.]